MSDEWELAASDLAKLIERLQAEGYVVIGPTVVDGVIQYREINSLDQLPRGVRDEQGPGFYQLSPSDENKYFGFNLGADSWRAHLLPPSKKVFSAQRSANTFFITEHRDPPRKLALLGVRPCELRAITIQDKVFLGSDYIQPMYADQRAEVLTIAVNCTTAAATCFCPSFGINAEATSGFDIALTEILEPNRHYFLMEAQTELGKNMVAGLGVPPAPASAATKKNAISPALAAITRHIDEKAAVDSNDQCNSSSNIPICMSTFDEASKANFYPR